MEITLADGVNNTLLNTRTWERRYVNLSQHAMRLHVYNQEKNVATEQYVPGEKAAVEIAAYMTEEYNGSGVWESCRWIHVKNRATEMKDASNYRRMIRKHLEGYWGDKVEVTGTSVRDVYYVSDGGMSSTPSAIGLYRRSPLVFKGKAVGTIFKIGGKDVLSNDSCVVYWLPKPWWEGFHTRYRGVPRDFPNPCGFAFSNWCQRFGHANYGDGRIWIADMSQAQTVQAWTTGNLVNIWNARGVDLLRYANAKSVTLRRSNRKFDARSRMAVLIAANKSEYGRVGTVCMECGRMLESPYGECLACGCGNYILDMVAHSRVWCRKCGKRLTFCRCEEPAHAIMSEYHHNQHRRSLVGVYRKVFKGKGPSLEYF